MIPLLLRPLVAALTGALVPHLIPGPAPPPGDRTEYFLLEQDPGGAAMPAAVIALGRVALEAGCLLEQEVLFLEGGVRVLHNELLTGQTPRMVWRELRSGAESGKTWLVERALAEGQVRTVSWGQRRPVHGRIPSADPPVFPLELLERLRRGEPVGAQVLSLDPLGEATVILGVTVWWGDRRDPRPAQTLVRGLAGAVLGRWTSLARPWARAAWRDLPPSLPGPADPWRTVELRRPDGSLAGRYVFHGRRLDAFQWQAGTRWARPIEEGEFRHLAQAWARPYDPLADLRLALAAGRILRR